MRVRWFPREGSHLPKPSQKFSMDKNVSIVKVDKRPHRTIARENWGLTKEQMKGKHVHHRIKRSEGGTNDPSNLYVCSPSFHRYVWHNGEEFIEFAEMGAKRAHAEKDENGKSRTAVKAGKSAHTNRDENGKSKTALKGIQTQKENRLGFYSEDWRKGWYETEDFTLHQKKAAQVSGTNHRLRGTGVFARSPEEISADGRKGGTSNAINKTGFCAPGVARKGGLAVSRQKWADPDHPELGVQMAGNLVRMQKRRNLPHGKENRVRVG